MNTEILVNQEVLEPPNPGLEGLCSIQLRYWTKGKSTFLVTHIKGG